MQAAQLSALELGTTMSFRDEDGTNVTALITGLYVNGGEVLLTNPDVQAEEWIVGLLDDVTVQPQGDRVYTTTRTQIPAHNLTAQFIGRRVRFTTADDGTRVDGELRQIEMSAEEIIIWTCGINDYSGDVQGRTVTPTTEIDVVTGTGIVEYLTQGG